MELTNGRTFPSFSPAAHGQTRSFPSLSEEGCAGRCLTQRHRGETHPNMSSPHLLRGPIVPVSPSTAEVASWLTGTSPAMDKSGRTPALCAVDQSESAAKADDGWGDGLGASITCRPLRSSTASRTSITIPACSPATGRHADGPMACCRRSGHAAKIIELERSNGLSTDIDGRRGSGLDPSAMTDSAMARKAVYEASRPAHEFCRRIFRIPRRPGSSRSYERRRWSPRAIFRWSTFR